ncbi:MAG: DHA2 family efflux MFS transporter permease subunit [bacterium]
MYTEKYKKFILILLISITFIVMLDMSIISIAIPKIIIDFKSNITEADWIVIGFSIATAVVIMPTTYIIRKIGIKIPIAVFIALFMLSSIMCGISNSLNMLIIFRVIQGIAAGGISPLGISLLSQIFEPHERGKAISLWGLGAMSAPALGPTIGGIIVSYLSWRWIFFINIPVSVITLLGIIFIMKNDYKNKTSNIPFDFIGFVFFTVFISSLLIIFNEGKILGWNSLALRFLEAISAVSFIIFFIFDLYAKHPLINFKLFKYYNFSLILILNGLRGISLFGSLFFLPIFLENVMRYSAYETGLIMMPSAVIMALISPISGRFTDKYGPKIFIVTGTILSALSFFLYWNLSLNSSVFDIVYPSIIRAVGIGIMYAPLMSEGINCVKTEDIPQASGLMPITMRISSVFGIAFFVNYFMAKEKFYAIFHKSISFFNISRLFNIQNMHISKLQATIYAYDSVYILAGIICLIGIFPAIMLKNNVYKI